MASIPSTMKALVLTAAGVDNNLKYVSSFQVPSLGKEEVLVKNNIAGVNFVDLYYQSGHYPISAPFPLVLGQEAAGTVVAVPEPNDSDLQVGDRVITWGMGAYAEYSAVPTAKVVKIEPEITDEQAVGVHVVGLTALSLITEGYPAQKGETILVHAAAGGVGLVLCQLLRHRGVTVIGTAGGPEKCALAKENGAHHVFDYRATDGPSWVEQVKAVTNGQGVHAVFDSVGKDTWKGSFEVTRRKGKVVFIGSASGPVPPIELSYSRQRNISVLNSTVMQSIITRDELEFYARQVQNLVKEGVLKVNIHGTYPLAEVEKALKELEGRRTMGKLLIKI